MEYEFLDTYRQQVLLQHFAKLEQRFTFVQLCPDLKQQHALCRHESPMHLRHS